MDCLDDNIMGLSLFMIDPLSCIFRCMPLHELHVLRHVNKHLHKNVHIFAFQNNITFQFKILNHYSARKNKNIEMIKWTTKNCYFDENVFLFYAAEAGYINLLEWGLSHNFKYNQCEIMNNFRLCENNKQLANQKISYQQHLNINTIMEKSIYDITIYNTIIDGAIKGGHLDVLKWSYKNDLIPSKSILSWMKIATFYNQLDILKWFREKNKLPAGNFIFCFIAACKNHVEVFKWLVQTGCSIENGHAFAMAITLEHSEIVEWIKKYTSDWDCKQICTYAIKYSNFDLLKWAIKQGYSVDPDICNIAAKHGQFEILKWLIDEKSYKYEHKICDYAAGANHFEMLKWLHLDKKLKMNSRKVGICAAKFGNLDMIKLLADQNYHVDKFVPFYALKFGRFNVLHWYIHKKLLNLIQKIHKYNLWVRCSKSSAVESYHKIVNPIKLNLSKLFVNPIFETNISFFESSTIYVLMVILFLLYFVIIIFQ